MTLILVMVLGWNALHFTLLEQPLMTYSDHGGESEAVRRFKVASIVKG